MRRATIAALALIGCLTLFAMSACGGDFASPTTTDYETTTTTTTTTAAAEMTQTHNRSGCVGLLNLGSCNTIQVNTQIQTAHRVPGVPQPAPDNGMTGPRMVTTLALLCLVFVFVVGVAGAVMGSGGYN